MCLGWQDLNAQGDCATAVDVTANLTATCNVITNTATFTGGGLEDICGMASAPTDAIWFSFTAPFDGLFDVTNTMDPLTPDTQMGIGTGTCGTLTCQPNWTATVDDGGNGFTSAMMGTAMTAGTTYYIEWGDGWATGPADFEIRLVEAANASILNGDYLVLV